MPTLRSWLMTALFLSLSVTLPGWYTQHNQLDSIKARGTLKVATRIDPSCYYIDQHGPNGFEVQLARRFADSLGVGLEIIPVSTTEELLDLVNHQAVDLVAAGLAITPARNRQLLFSEPYRQITERVIYRDPALRPRQPEDLIGREIYVAAASSHEEHLATLQQHYPMLDYTASRALSQEDMLMLVADGIIDYTVIDSYTFAAYRTLFPDLKAGLSLGQARPVAWAIARHNDNSLLEAINHFMVESRQSGTLAQLERRFMDHLRDFNYVEAKAFLAHIESRLPRYLEDFKQAAAHYGLDWRLLAAMSYQESLWDPRAISPTGVEGLMMLTRATAREVGIEDRTNPSQSIEGGARYIRKLLDRLPEDIPAPDRMWMALAAYNAGYGHVTDARLLAEAEGDPGTNWQAVKKRLPLLKDPAWYRQTAHGFARGGAQAVVYVREIRKYYDLLVWATANQSINNTLLAFNQVESPSRRHW